MADPPGMPPLEPIRSCDQRRQQARNRRQLGVCNIMNKCLFGLKAYMTCGTSTFQFRVSMTGKGKKIAKTMVLAGFSWF